MGWEGEEGKGIMDGSERERDRRVLAGEGGVRTEDEFLNRRVDVDAVSHFQLVDLELQPLAERLELGSHFGLRGFVRKRGCNAVVAFSSSGSSSSGSLQST
jgi:hypothetical protein